MQTCKLTKICFIENYFKLYYNGLLNDLVRKENYFVMTNLFQNINKQIEYIIQNKCKKLV